LFPSAPGKVLKDIHELFPEIPGHQKMKRDVKTRFAYDGMLICPPVSPAGLRPQAQGKRLNYEDDGLTFFTEILYLDRLVYFAKQPIV
jgi:hypothetical protein